MMTGSSWASVVGTADKVGVLDGDRVGDGGAEVVGTVAVGAELVVTGTLVRTGGAGAFAVRTTLGLGRRVGSAVATGTTVLGSAQDAMPRHDHGARSGGSDAAISQPPTGAAAMSSPATA